jgi:hypothetical protein
LLATVSLPGASTGFLGIGPLESATLSDLSLICALIRSAEKCFTLNNAAMLDKKCLRCGDVGIYQMVSICGPSSQCVEENSRWYCYYCFVVRRRVITVSNEILPPSHMMNRILNRILILTRRIIFSLIFNLIFSLRHERDPRRPRLLAVRSSWMG